MAPSRFGLQRSIGGINVVAAAVKAQIQTQKDDTSEARRVFHQTKASSHRSKQIHDVPSNEDLMNDLVYANQLVWEDRKYARAISVLSRVVVKQRDRLGMFHQDVAWTYYLMGTTQFMARKPLEALDYFCEARRVFGFSAIMPNEHLNEDDDDEYNSQIHKRQDSDISSSTWSCDSDTSTHALSNSPDPTFDTSLSPTEAFKNVSDRTRGVLQEIGFTEEQIQEYESTLSSVLDCEQRAYQFKDQGDMIEAEMYYEETKNLSVALKQLTADRLGSKMKGPTG